MPSNHDEFLIDYLPIETRSATIQLLKTFYKNNEYGNSMNLIKSNKKTQYTMKCHVNIVMQYIIKSKQLVNHGMFNKGKCRSK